MKTLKINNKLFLLLTILICEVSFGQDIYKEINPEEIRNDVLKHTDYMFPETYIKNTSTNKFNIFYFSDLCLVHIGYKNSEVHSTEKFSLIMFYMLNENEWKYKKSIPYYYNLQLIDKEKGIFFSNNLFCSMNGSCNRFVEICALEDMDLKPLANYSGFNNLLFYDRLLVYDEIEQVLKAKGDTICNDYEINNIKIDPKGIINYTIKQKVSILDGIISDTLNIRTFTNNQKQGLK